MEPLAQIILAIGGIVLFLAGFFIVEATDRYVDKGGPTFSHHDKRFVRKYYRRSLILLFITAALLGISKICGSDTDVVLCFQIMGFVIVFALLLGAAFPLRRWL